VPALRPYLDEFCADPFANRHIDQLPSEGVFQEFPRLRVVLIESPVHLATDLALAHEQRPVAGCVRKSPGSTGPLTARGREIGLFQMAVRILGSPTAVRTRASSRAAA
jgi:predicted TIM-barrel fold metal-dependent hydrolase